MDNINNLLKEKKMTLKELSQMTGINRTAMYRILHKGYRNDSAMRIAEALSVPLWRLFVSDEDAIADISERGKFKVFCSHCGEEITFGGGDSSEKSEKE